MKPFVLLVAACVGCTPSASDMKLAAYGAEQNKCIDDNSTPEAARACIAAVRAKFYGKDAGHD